MVELLKITQTLRTALNKPSNDVPDEDTMYKEATDYALSLARLLQQNWLSGFQEIKKLSISRDKLRNENKNLRHEKKQIQKEHDALVRARQMDDLTGLYTRNFMMNALENMGQKDWVEADERRTIAGNCLLMIDLDKFKPINDTYGHAAGDKALKVVAEALQKNIRKTDIAARMGGDEFVVILKGASKAGAEMKVKRIYEMFETLDFEWNGVRLPLGASIGCAMIDNTRSPADILKEADNFMYISKRNKGTLH